MALNIRNKETEVLAAKLARLTGETKTEAVRKALEDRWALLAQKTPPRRLADRLEEIAREFDSLPVYDTRSAEEILGYDEFGLPS